jgi:hypothetical protein|tara:strand:- start:948 stop:1142 length:195 start_codon:yes stop_codon:yes gene_type:complete
VYTKSAIPLPFNRKRSEMDKTLASIALKKKAAAKQLANIAICLFKRIFVNLQYFLNIKQNNFSK